MLYAVICILPGGFPIVRFVYIGKIKLVKVKMTQTYPKISIVTPSYNQAKFLDDAIKSVIDQGYPNFEHIIFDNCSTDGTTELLKKYPHLIWISERDQGQSDALNKGLRRATGEFVGWLNADDRYLPDCFYSVTKTLQAHPECDILYGDYRWVDKNGDLIKLRREIDFDLFIFKYLHVTYIPSTATFFRRDIFKENNFLNTDYKLANDFELFLRLALKGYHFNHLGLFLADYRWHPESKSELNKNRQIKEKEKALFSHDKVMQKVFQPFRPSVRFLFMLAARLKRAYIKTVNYLI
jgi:glycosyltransferase involved in cell wall biosynthesis